MLSAAIEQADRLDAATDRLGGSQQLDARPTLAELDSLLDLIEANQRDDAALVADVAHEPWRVGKDQQTLRLEGGRDLHGQSIALHVDGGALVADGRRSHHRQVSVVQQQAQKLRLDALAAAPGAAGQTLRLCAL